jgi:putative Mg2+ transporter-C (MgtC) family protein
VPQGIEIGLEFELLLRLIVALALGALVGWERELQQMPAGFRTHALVSLGSAVFTVISGYAFAGAGADPTRIAAQIVSGIGFLGGGAILRHGGSVRGLTTAASLWAVAAIGMAAGAGLFVIAVGGALLVIVTLELFQRFERMIKRRFDLPGSPRPPTDEAEEREGD